jgi:hypothetical protein
MPFRNLVRDTEVAQILNTALGEICRAAGIKPGSPDTQHAMAFVMGLYWRGHRKPDELRAAVNEAIDRERG